MTNNYFRTDLNWSYPSSDELTAESFNNSTDIVEEISQSNRSGETYSQYRRNPRIFYFDRRWYFSTREGVDFGPYDNELQAEIALKQFIIIMNSSSETVE